MAFDYQKGEVYFRGEFVAFDKANLSIASSPVLYGSTVYTVFSANWNIQQKKLYVFRLKDHYQRLINSAKIMDFHDFADNFTYQEFEEIMLELLKHNKIKEDILVRSAVFIDELIAGTRVHGLRNSFSAYIYPMGKILPKEGIKAQVSSWVRTPDNSIPSRAKINGSYVNASLMKNEALLNGYDEAISIDQNGHVAEGTVANLFIIRNGVLLTPSTSTDILEGITRDSVMTIAKKQGYMVEQRSIDRSELYIADEVFMCGSSAQITPVTSIDKRSVGDGKPGPITKELANLYGLIQRGEVDDTYDWLLLAE